MKLNTPISRSVLSGLLLVLSWPPVGLTFLLPLAFVPLLVNLVCVRSGAKAIFLAFVSLFIWTAGTMYWLVLVDMPGSNTTVLLSAFVLIPSFMLLPIIFTRFLLKKFSGNALILLPFFWAAYEFLHSKWDLAFTWLNLGFGLSPAAFFIQFYEYTGYLGGSFLIMALNVCIAYAFVQRQKTRKSWIMASLGVSGLAILINTIAYPFSRDKSKQEATVAVVQPNADPYEKLDEKSLYKRTMALLEQIKTVPESTALIVGPEGYLKNRPSAPVILNELSHNPAVKAIEKQLNKTGSALIIGGIGVWEYKTNTIEESAAGISPNGKAYTLHNASLFISPSGREAFSVKQHMVPFMERVPFLNKFPVADRLKFDLNQMNLNYSSSDSLPLFSHRRIKTVTAICIDAQFPVKLAKGIRKGANCITVISNDGWAGRSAGYIQNASYSRALATSFRKPVIRSANTGESLIIDEKGSVLSSAGWKKKTILREKISLNPEQTFYLRYPNLSGLLSLVLIPFIFIALFIEKKTK